MTRIASRLHAAGGPSFASPSAAAIAGVHREASMAGGDTDRIPRLLLGAGDLGTLVAAFVAAHVFAPVVQQMLLTGGAFEGVLPSGMFALPPVPRPELFPPLTEVSWILVATAPVTLIALEMLGGYGRLLSHSFGRLAMIAAVSQPIAIGFSALIVFALKLSSSSRVMIFTYGLFSAAGLLVFRTALWTYQRRRLAAGGYAKNVLLIGQPRAVEWMVAHFRANVPDTEFRLQGWLRVAPDRTHTPERRRDDATRDIPIECLGGVNDLGELLVHTPIHEVIAVQSSVAREWLRPVVEFCDYFRIRLRIVPEALLVGTLRDLEVAFRDDPLRLPEVVLSPRYLDTDALIVKRLIDIAVSATLLVLFAPLFLLIAIAIKLTTPDLPVFYPWHVVGLSGRRFTGYKFTTMAADADARKAELQHLNEMQGPVFKIRNDPRVTPLGRVLRKYSLNELPQLWSVLKGDMSLVGPRPAFRHELQRFELWHKRKLCVKPGITCLWQISGRNHIADFDDWVRLDLEYIEKWSLWLDTKILARTVWAVVAGSGS
jgi:exopolysaccharide biosynthesis polyprenyl glycosylphosphotransferase